MDPMTIHNHLRAMGPGSLMPSRPEVPLPAPAAVSDEAPKGPSFAEVLGEQMHQVNQQMLDADAMVAELAEGQSANVHGTLIALQKADISFKLLVEVRNKVVKAYEEVMRMQA